eukprot:823565_1
MAPTKDTYHKEYSTPHLEHQRHNISRVYQSLHLLMKQETILHRRHLYIPPTLIPLLASPVAPTMVDIPSDEALWLESIAFVLLTDLKRTNHTRFIL